MRKPRQAKKSTGTPVAGLLFDPSARPALADLVALARADRKFCVTHQMPDIGQAELSFDGLAFDCCGLAPGAALRVDTALQQVALPGDFPVADHDLVTLSPGPHLEGAGQLLPVVQILAGLIMSLDAMPGLRAVVWLPARLAMSAAWFAQAIGAWLKGGPFPALALTGLARSERGIASQGLSYFVGQEFTFSGKGGILRKDDMHGAVRLTDWLVAHGRVNTRREIELPGFGMVLLEPDGPDHLRARSL